MELWGLFYFAWTVLCYFFAKQLFIRTQKIYCSPIIVVPILSIGLILFFAAQLSGLLPLYSISGCDAGADYRGFRHSCLPL